MERKDLTRGNIKKQLWSVAWPLILSVFFYTLYNIIDAFWVSKISAEAIAAVSISQVVLFAMVAISMGIAVGSGVIMAMHIGAKNIKEAERVLGQSFILAGIIAIFFTVLALIFKNELLLISGAKGAIFEPALAYFSVISAGAILFFILMTIIFAFNSQGDTFTLTKLLALSILVNVVLDPILIFGLFDFPQLGIEGAAIATLISQAVFITIAIRSLSSPKRKIRFHFYNLTFKWESVKKVLMIGIPASFTQVLNPVGQAAILLILSLSFLEPGTIAYSIGFRIEFFAFLPAIGFGFGAMALISQNVGAGNLDRAKKSFRTAMEYGVLSATGIGVLAILLSGFIIGVFTKDPTVTNYAQSYIWIVALSYGMLAAMMIEASAFQAIGRSWPGFWISFLRLVVITIPLSYILTQIYSFPITAVWIAVLSGNFTASILGYIWIRKTINKLDLSKVPVHK